jgi:hypothetical protein
MDNDDMKQEVLEKVYQVDDQNAQSQLKHNQEDRIDELEAQLNELLLHIKKSQKMTALSSHA